MSGQVGQQGAPAAGGTTVNMQGSDIEISPCPVCAGDGEYAYTGSDLLYDKPGDYHYGRCTRCGAEYLTPMPDGDTIASFYPSDYMVYEPLGKSKPRSLPERCVLNARYGYSLEPRGLLFRVLGWLLGLIRYKDLVPFEGGGRALDVGCGNGKFVRTLINIGWDAEGSDFSPDAVKSARAAGLTVHQGTLDSADFEPGSFDLVSARHVIEHVPDPVPFVRDIHRLLRAGGRFLVRTPNSHALGRGWFGTRWYANDVPRHVVMYSLETLDQLLSTHGFERVTARGFSSPKYMLNSWDYVDGDQGGKPRRKRKLFRFLGKLYALVSANLPGRADELFVIYRKR